MNEKRLFYLWLGVFYHKLHGWRFIKDYEGGKGQLAFPCWQIANAIFWHLYYEIITLHDFVQYYNTLCSSSLPMKTNERRAMSKFEFILTTTCFLEGGFWVLCHWSPNTCWWWPPLALYPQCLLALSSNHNFGLNFFRFNFFSKKKKVGTCLLKSYKIKKLIYT